MDSNFFKSLLNKPLKESFHKIFSIFKELFQECTYKESEFKECKECQNKIAFFKNCVVVSVFYICTCIISRKNLIKGSFTFNFLFLFFAYFIHYITHKYKCFPTILHHYHHHSNCFFSHFVQISAELTIIIWFYPIYYFSGTTFFDIWQVVYYLLMYSSIHNINYGYLHVNNFHELHHDDPMTNMGPEFCDAFYGTKHEKHPDTEHALHHIPNAIINAIIVLGLQYICLNKTYEEFLKNAFICFEFSFTFICILSSIYIYYCFPDVLKG